MIIYICAAKNENLTGTTMDDETSTHLHSRSYSRDLVECMLYMVRCNPIYLVSMRQCGLDVVLWSHIGMLMHLLATEPQFRRTFILLTVSLWTYLGDPVFDGVGLAGFKTGPMPFYWPSCSLILSPFFPFYSFILQVGIVGLGSSD